MVEHMFPTMQTFVLFHGAASADPYAGLWQQKAPTLRSRTMSPRAAPLASAPASANTTTQRAPLIRRLVKPLLWAYLRPFHRLELRGAEHIPPHGPAIVVINHASLLDVPVLMALDPFPNTATVVKASMFKLPVIGWILRRWGAIPVEREGRDSASSR